MFDFRLKVFLTVARRLNFTRAAEELFISQPAVTKHIREIEKHYRVQLFERHGTRIRLTGAGKLLLEYAEKLFSMYRQMEMDLAASGEKVKGELRIGASTTVAQYILPQYLAAFKNKFPDVLIHLNSANTERIEEQLMQNQIDAGIVEGRSRRKELKYQNFLRDEIVLCSKNTEGRKGIISPEKLKQIPLVLREQGSGTREVITAALQKAGLQFNELKVDMVLESTESIKNYLLYSDCYAFLSIHSILVELANRTLAVTDVQSLTIQRHFVLVKRLGDNQPSTELLWRFLSSHNPTL